MREKLKRNGMNRIELRLLVCSIEYSVSVYTCFAGCKNEDDAKQEEE